MFTCLHICIYICMYEYLYIDIYNIYVYLPSCPHVDAIIKFIVTHAHTPLFCSIFLISSISFPHSLPLSFSFDIFFTEGSHLFPF